MNNLTEEERVLSVLVCFEGLALSWLQYREKRGTFVRWEDLRREVMQHFGSTQRRSPEEELITLRHTASVAEYREKFEALAVLVPVTLDDWLLGVFMAGLAPVIAADVRLFKPENLDSAMELAQSIEVRDLARMGILQGQVQRSVSKDSSTTFVASTQEAVHFNLDSFGDKCNQGY